MEGLSRYTPRSLVPYIAVQHVPHIEREFDKVDLSGRDPSKFQRENSRRIKSKLDAHQVYPEESN